MLFCISFYHAIIRPQLEPEIVEADNNIYWSSDIEENKIE
jgi:hypothetical protein